jgi:MFS family permease
MFNTNSKFTSNNQLTTVLVALSAFFTYLCFYPFRRAYTAASYEDLYFWGIHYKILIITAQVLGFAISKGIGVKIVSEMQAKDRVKNLLFITLISWFCMVLFAVTPAPYNLIFILLGSLPLGLFYGIVLGFLEGRRTTDLLVAVLTASFIIGSGFSKSVGNWLLVDWQISEFWMPAVADSIMFIPLIFSLLLLSKTPPPDTKDIEERVERLPMNGEDRKAFINQFRPGLVLFIASYIILTAYREYRDNFAPEILKELGFANLSGIFTKTEVPIAVFVLLIMASMRWVKNSKLAFNIIQIIMLLGGLIILLSTYFFQAGYIPPIYWLISAGFGVYISFAMSNSLYFERMLAYFQTKGTIGFLITLADFFAYIGSISMLYYKNFYKKDSSNVDFFISVSYFIGIVYFILILVSSIYYSRKSPIR